jgi:hypothetical protein
MVHYRIKLRCDGIPVDESEAGARCITSDFRMNRTWHQNAVCTWDGRSLHLTVENDFDKNGLATLDEFSDELSACLEDGGYGDLVIVSVEPIGSPSSGGA